MAKAKAKNIRRSKKRIATKPASDTALIRECVIYAQSVAAMHKGFRADPGGSSEIAATLGHKHTSRAWQALTKIAATPATTPLGLCSKARIVAIVFEDADGQCGEEDQIAFLKSFGDEVKNFLQPICDGDLVLQSPVTAIP